MKQHDLSYWEDLAERYFLAETSEREEAQLRKFLCSSSEASDPRFDDVRATMSFLHVSRQKRTSGEESIPIEGESWRAPRLLLAFAACLCLAAFLGWHQYHQHNVSSVRIAGEDVEMDASQLMQKQMAEMFNPIDQSDR